MIRIAVLNLCFSLLVVGLCSCDSGHVAISTTEEIKNHADSVKFAQAVLSYNEGKQLFGRFCNACHVAPEINKTDQYLFDNLFERLPAPSEDYFVRFISDSKELKASGDRYALAVDDVWSNDYEHQFKDSLSRQDFYDLIMYIKIADRQRYK